MFVVEVVEGPSILQPAGSLVRVANIVTFIDSVDIVGAVSFDVPILLLAKPGYFKRETIVSESQAEFRWLKGGTDLLVDRDESSRTTRCAPASRRTKIAVRLAPAGILAFWITFRRFVGEKFAVLRLVKKSGQRRIVGVKLSVIGAASAMVGDFWQSSVLLQETIKFSGKLEPDWMLPNILVTVAESVFSK